MSNLTVMKQISRQDRRPRPPKPGKAQRGRQRLWEVLRAEPEPVTVTNVELATHLGISSKQVQRYLNVLREEGLIASSTSRYRVAATGNWMAVRKIEVQGRS